MSTTTGLPSAQAPGDVGPAVGVAGDAGLRVGVLHRLAGEGVAAALVALDDHVGVGVDQEPLGVPAPHHRAVGRRHLLQEFDGQGRGQRQATHG